MKKSIRSLEKRIVEHENKIKNASIIYPEWRFFSEERKYRVIKGWELEIKIF